MKILVTGFQPFNDEKINPSELLLSSVAKQGYAVQLLPVEYEGAFAALKRTVLADRFEGVLMLGQASGRTAVCLERVALNWEECDFADEGGTQRKGQFIDENGQQAFINRLPLSQWQKNLEARGLPVEVSLSAGAFVCNSTYYRVMNEIKRSSHFLKWALFVHVPFLPEQLHGKPPGTPALALEKMNAVIGELLALISAEKNLES